MKILIPLAPGTEPPMRVLAAIDAQTIPCDVVTKSLPYTVRETQRLMRRRQNECDNRNALMERVAGNDYAAMMNHDVVMSSNHDFADCVEYLRNNPEWDAVALNTKQGQDIAKAEKRGHVVGACFVFRVAAFAGFKWQVDEAYCSCWKLNEKKIRYLDNRQLREAEKNHH